MQTHDITVYPDHPVEGLGARDIALLAEGGNYTGNGDTGSVFVIDVTDPAAPVVLNRWLHEQGPGHHPIHYHHEAQLRECDPSVMLVTDEDMHNGCGAEGATSWGAQFHEGYVYVGDMSRGLDVLRPEG
jgi:hypothetical protein